MQVRLSASFSYHFLGTFWQPQFKFIDILSYNDHDGLIRINRFMHPEEHNACTGCEGLFLRRLRQRLAEPPLLTPGEMLVVVKEVSTSLACDPLLASMHQVEDLHAHARIAAARSTDRRKHLPVRIFSGQYFSRWPTLHITKMGPLSIRQTILKTKRVRPLKPRTLTGHDIYVKRANAKRRVSAQRGGVSYRAHLTSTHAT